MIHRSLEDDEALTPDSGDMTVSKLPRIRWSLTLERMPRRKLRAMLILVTAITAAIMSVCFLLRDDLLFMWDDLAYVVPEDFINSRIERIVKNRGCTRRELSLLNDYCSRSAVGGLYAYGELWSLFIRDPELIRRLDMADPTGRVVFDILYNGPSCYLEYHDDIPDDLFAKATALYHHDLASHLPDAKGLREAWDKLIANREPSRHITSQATP